MASSLGRLPSDQLLSRLHTLIRRGNAVEAELLAHLGEVDVRRLYLREAFPSMFTWCVGALHFAEAVAYKRIAAARAARRHPEVLEAVRQGDLHVTAVSLLASQLTSGNCAELIQAARHKTADEIRRLLADRQPKPDVPASVRRVPVPSVEPPAMAQRSLPPKAAVDTPESRRLTPPAESPHPRACTRPLGGERYVVRFTADQELHEQLRELRALMRHQVPDGDVGKILARAVSVLLEQVRKQKFGETATPRPAKAPAENMSRNIPASIRRSVAKRDGGRCTYVSPGGRRCGAREFLEFHHGDPWAWAHTHSVEGIALRCRAHNHYAACRDFGERNMARFRKQSRQQDLNPVPLGTSGLAPDPRSPLSRSPAPRRAGGNAPRASPAAP
jgi:hypothetical protein